MSSYDVDEENGKFSKWRRVRFVTFAVVCQVAFIVLFAIFVECDESASPKKSGSDHEEEVITDAVRYYASLCPPPPPPLPRHLLSTSF